MFCKKCGSILKPSKEGLTCDDCGAVQKEKLLLGQKHKKEKKFLEHGLGDEEDSPHPVVDAKCKKCRNTKAYFMIKQTRSSDEAPTKFFRCTKCNFTWRKYD